MRAENGILKILCWTLTIQSKSHELSTAQTAIPEKHLTLIKGRWSTGCSQSLDFTLSFSQSNMEFCMFCSEQSTMRQAIFWL